MSKEIFKNASKEVIYKLIVNEIKKKLDTDGDITLTDICEFIALELNDFGDVFEKMVDSKLIQKLKEHEKNKIDQTEQLRKERERDHKIYMALKEKHKKDNK